MQELIRSGADDVKSKALQTAGNLAFCTENRILLRQSEGMREIMLRLADYTAATVKHEVRASAIRALAILGGTEYFLGTITYASIGHNVCLMTMIHVHDF